MKWRGQLLQWGDCEQKGAMAVVQSVLDSQGGPFLSIALQRGSFTLQFSWGLVYWVSDPFVCMAVFF